MLIGMSITALVISTSVSWASNDLFKNLANELLKAVEEEFEEEPQKKSAPSTGTPVKVNSREVVKQIQEGLNWFGYPAGTPDGLAGKKNAQRNNRITKVLASSGSRASTHSKN